MAKREILTDADVARLLQVDAEIVNRWVDERKIPHFRIDDLVRFRRETILTWAGALERQNPDNVALLPDSEAAARRASLTDRLSQAVELLKSGVPERHLVGLYALERIVGETEDTDASPVQTILTHFLREEFPGRDGSDEAPRTVMSHRAQSLLAVLVRLKNLRVVLRDADLSGADLRGADLSNFVLVNARLDHAHLDGADFGGGAEPTKARVALQRVSFRGASLQRADLRRANLLAADLGGADLRQARLDHADLEGADLTGAWLDGADLSGARLANAVGLDQSQIDAAVVDAATELPADVVSAVRIEATRQVGVAPTERIGDRDPHRGETQNLGVKRDPAGR